MEHQTHIKVMRNTSCAHNECILASPCRWKSCNKFCLRRFRKWFSKTFWRKRSASGTTSWKSDEKKVLRRFARQNISLRHNRLEHQKIKLTIFSSARLLIASCTLCCVCLPVREAQIDWTLAKMTLPDVLHVVGSFKKINKSSAWAKKAIKVKEKINFTRFSGGFRITQIELLNLLPIAAHCVLFCAMKYSFRWKYREKKSINKKSSREQKIVKVLSAYIIQF